MKTLFIFCLCLSCLPGFTQSSMNLSSTWRQASFHAGFDGTTSTHDYTISFRGDTVIDGRNYFLPESNGIVTIKSLFDGSVIEQYPVSQQLSPLREENAVLYRYHDNSSTDIALHNFEMSVGDTAISNCLEVVERIDTIYLGSTPIKRYTFEDNSVEQLIEGVGATRGLFHQPCSHLYFEASYHLFCYQQDGYTIQIDSSFSCESPSAAKTVQTMSAFVFPNPFRDQFQIRYSDDTVFPLTVSLISIQGQLIRDLYFSSPEQYLLIDASDVPPGVYGLQVKNAQTTYVTRIVKQ